MKLSRRQFMKKVAAAGVAATFPVSDICEAVECCFLSDKKLHGRKNHIFNGDVGRWDYVIFHIHHIVGPPVVFDDKNYGVISVDTAK